MAYKYISSGSPPYLGTTKYELTNGFQENLNEQFANSTTYQTIQEESVFGSGSLIDVNVRINRGVSSFTGLRLGDDFKTILFSDLSKQVPLGSKFFFASNYWITTFTENIMNLAASCLVRRCNSRLRWMGTNGTYYEEPCAIEYKISRPRDSVGTENPVLPQGFVDVYTQINDKTRTIKSNQRFLFGPAENRICLKVFGTGLMNAQNQETLDDQSSKLLILSMGGNYINNDTDNIALGIADYYLDYNKITSASSVGGLDIIITPNVDSLLESGSVVYDVKYYSGSTIHSGSFVFSISGSNVPASNYTFNSLSANTFSVVNNAKWLTDTLNINCSGSSGSRVLNLELRGAY